MVSDHRATIDIRTEKRHADALLGRAMGWGSVIGAVSLAAAFSLGWFVMRDGLRHVAHSYLVSFMYFLSLALGGLFFVSMHHLTRSGWSVVVRRLGEVIAGSVAVMAVLALPVIALSGVLYEWSGHGAAEAGHGEHALPGIKYDYLGLGFFVVRMVIYFGVWWLLSWRFLRRSVAQDRTGDPRETLKLERLSPLATILFAFTVTFASFDLLMSLHPLWYSTIFGVYYFSGCAVGFLSFLVVCCVLLQRAGVLRQTITVEHYHDVGKLLFAFIMFWAYVAFSQYMLIWYANIPEETAWYAVRQAGGWGWVAVVFLVLGHFVVPFAGLMSRHMKRRRAVLTFWAVWMLVMHYVDLYWLVMPRVGSGRVPLHVVDLLTFVGVGGLFVAGVAMLAKGRSLVPEKDPRLAESLAFENA